MRRHNFDDFDLAELDAKKKALVRVAPKWRDERYSDLRWGKSPGELRFIRLVRAELLKLRRRRGLLAITATLTIVPMIVGLLSSLAL